MPSYHDKQSRPQQRPQQQQGRPRFQYRQRSEESLNQRAERTSRWDSVFKPGFDSFKVPQGESVIRFLPPTWDNAEHYAYDIWQHSFIGPEQGSYLCIYKHQNKPCPICAIAERAKVAGDQEEERKHRVVLRRLAWIIDRDGDNPNKPLLFSMSETQDIEIVTLCKSRHNHAALWIDDPDNGYDVAFTRTGTGLATRYTGYQIMRDPSTLHKDQRTQDRILDYVQDNPIPEVLQFYPGDYILRAITGTVHSQPDEDTSDLLQRPQRTARRPDPYEEDGATLEEDLPAWNESRGNGRAYGPEEAEEEAQQTLQRRPMGDRPRMRPR